MVTPMIKTLTKHGNSLALVIEKPILELLHIDQTTGLNISTDGTSLVIFPVKSVDRKQKIQEALKDINQQYGRALANLAK